MLDREPLIPRTRAWIAFAALALLAACSGPGEHPAATTAAPAAAIVQPLAGTQAHVGRAVCGNCHRAELEAWQGSHHDLAMQEADAGSVLGDFADATFEYAGTTSVFTKRDDRFFVRTDGPDGRIGDFRIRYTFGHFPLQQYLIELPGGRLQAFGIAWDSRPANAGGQRWFHLYPGQNLKAGDRLHWTGADQNWNFMCAGCHSTGIEKNYDAATGRYASTWAEIDVSCEACHGPGLAHARWAALPSDARAADPAKGLEVAFHERRGIVWQRDAASAIAHRSSPRSTRIEIDACGRCHGRANRLVGGEQHIGSLLDSHRPALLDPGTYWPDGQMRGEVFNWGPFLQSRMQAAGVTCSDCHRPHDLALRAKGNALCTTCHSPEHFDRTTHTHHASGSSGSECIACHMPRTVFMQIDARHDHGFRIPRPDLGVRLGVPDACTGCHVDRDQQWAATTLERWYPHSPHRQAGFAEVLDDAQKGAPRIAQRLADIAAAPAQPAIVRASALRAMAPWLNPAAVRQATKSLADADPLVRMAAVETLAVLEPAQKATLLAALTADKVLAVRIEAAAALAGAPERTLAPAQRGAFEAALAEYESSLRFNADRPDTTTSLGELYLRRGNYAAAETELRRALELDPEHVPALLQQAELARARGDDASALGMLQSAAQRLPDAAGLQHALGLALVRAGRTAHAIDALERAATLEPATPQYAYVLAVALHDHGQVARARTTLSAAVARSPHDRELLRTSALYSAEQGDRMTARNLASRYLAIDPDDADAQQLAGWLAR
jgi:predicted CXXCH cytochrome family protein